MKIQVVLMHLLVLHLLLLLWKHLHLLQKRQLRQRLQLLLQKLQVRLLLQLHTKLSESVKEPSFNAWLFYYELFKTI
jgi:hypothetical protein